MFVEDAGGIVGRMAVASVADGPQTALWQPKPDLPGPWSLVISTTKKKINAHEGHFGRRERRTSMCRVRSQSRQDVSVCVHCTYVACMYKLFHM